MKLTIEVEMNNQAFHEQAGHGAEATRILTKLAGELEGYDFEELPQSGFLRDVNGNTVGSWKITK